MGAGARRPRAEAPAAGSDVSGARPVEVVSATTGEVLATLSLTATSSLKDVKAGHLRHKASRGEWTGVS